MDRPDPQMYAILHNGEDGPSAVFVEKEELLRRITPDKDGNNYYGIAGTKFMDGIPDHFDEYSYDGILILKVELVVPKEKRVVTQLEID